MLWHHLRSKQFLGLKFRRQQPIDPYIADFVCFEKHLIIELDGGQHAIDADKDRTRAQHLNRKGYTVLRFWNHDLMKNPEAVLNQFLSDVGPGHAWHEKLLRNPQMGQYFIHQLQKSASFIFFDVYFSSLPQ